MALMRRIALFQRLRGCEVGFSEICVAFRVGAGKGWNTEGWSMRPLTAEDTSLALREDESASLALREDESPGDWIFAGGARQGESNGAVLYR
jgi:hypothetical protein